MHKRPATPNIRADTMVANTGRPPVVLAPLLILLVLLNGLPGAHAQAHSQQDHDGQQLELHQGHQIHLEEISMGPTQQPSHSSQQQQQHQQHQQQQHQQQQEYHKPHVNLAMMRDSMLSSLRETSSVSPIHQDVVRTEQPQLQSHPQSQPQQQHHHQQQQQQQQQHPPQQQHQPSPQQQYHQASTTNQQQPPATQAPQTQTKVQVDHQPQPEHAPMSQPSQQQQQQLSSMLAQRQQQQQQLRINQIAPQYPRSIDIVQTENLPQHQPQPQMPLSQSHSAQSQQQKQASRQPIAAYGPSPQPTPPSLHTSYHRHPSSPLYLGHNPFIEILRPQSYADDNIVTLNLSHSHIYEIDSDAFVGQRFEHIDLSNNKLGLIHSRSFRIGPFHSRHNPYNPSLGNSSKPVSDPYPPRRPPPAHPKSVTIDFSHNPAIVALSGAFDHIDVPNCLLNFTNSTVELKFGAFKKYFKEHPGHIIDIESVDCCEQEWLLGYKHNFVPRTHCDHDPNLLLTKIPQQTIIDSCIAYVTSARHSMTIQGPSIIHQVAAAPRHHSNAHADNQYLTYMILGGTAMILTSLSIYIIFYMFSLKAAFVYQMQNKS